MTLKRRFEEGEDECVMLRDFRGIRTCPLSCVLLLFAQDHPGLSEGLGVHRNLWRKFFPPMDKGISQITALAISILGLSVTLTYPYIPLSPQRRSTQSSTRTQLVTRMK